VKPIIVLKYEGKGSYSSADYVSAHLFESYEEAVDFCLHEQVLGKYWTLCDIIKEGQRFEPTIQDENYP
jgi:hypothetical protein